MNLSKYLIIVVLSTSVTQSALALGFGYKPVKLYSGETRPDTELSALIHGYVTEKDGELWVAMLVALKSPQPPPRLIL